MFIIIKDMFSDVLFRLILVELHIMAPAIRKTQTGIKEVRREAWTYIFMQPIRQSGD